MRAGIKVDLVGWPTDEIICKTETKSKDMQIVNITIVEK